MKTKLVTQIVSAVLITTLSTSIAWSWYDKNSLPDGVTAGSVSEDGYLDDSLFMDTITQAPVPMMGINRGELDRYVQQNMLAITARIQNNLPEAQEAYDLYIQKGSKFAFYAIYDAGVGYLLSKQEAITPELIIYHGVRLSELAKSIAKEYRTKPEYIQAIINKETYGGSSLGDTNLVQRFQAQIADKTIKYWDPQGQLDALKFICDQLKIDYNTAKGSSAGAIGIPQIMPLSLKNIWNKTGKIIDPFTTEGSMEVVAYLMHSYGATNTSTPEKALEAFRFYNAGGSKYADGTLKGYDYAYDVTAWAHIYSGAVPAPFGLPFNSWDSLTTTAGFRSESYFKRFHVQHDGVDVAVKGKTKYKEFKDANAFPEVKSTQPGFVVYALWPKGFGYHAWLCSGDNVVSHCVAYGHLSQDSIPAKEALTDVPADKLKIIEAQFKPASWEKVTVIGMLKSVDKFQTLGRMGSTGFSTKEHLHYQVNRKVLDHDWEPQNPKDFYINEEQSPFVVTAQQ